MNIGILGLGSIGMRHARNLIAMGHTVNGFDPNEKAQREFCKASSTTRTGADAFKGAFERTKALVVASPTSEHKRDLSHAIEGGYHVFIEKPIADDKQHLTDWLEVAEHANLVVFVGYNLRFHPCVIQAKKWLTQGRIGRPLWSSIVCAQYTDKPPYKRDGVLLNWSHEIDLALYLFGQATVASSYVRAHDGHDDMADIVLRHETECVSHVHIDYLANPQFRYSKIVGEKGTIEIDLAEGFARVKNNNINHMLMMPNGGFDQSYVDEMTAFVQRVEGQETLGATGWDGLRALEIVLEAKQLAGLT